MKIFLLLNQPYPNGYALTKRFHLYAKGLIQLGHNVKVIIPFPVEKSSKSINNIISGVYEGVPFEYQWKNTTRSKNFFIRRYHDFLGLFKTALNCYKEKPDFIISASFPLLFFLFLRFISLFRTIRLIREINEVVNMHEEKLTPHEKMLTRLKYSLYDGLIIISQQLSNYLTHELKIKGKNIIVPVLIDDFKPNVENTIRKIIVYTGTYLERKDGIVTILKAFALIKNKYPDYKLVLTGAPERSPDYKEIKNTITNYELSSQIIFTGYIGENELYQTLGSAIMLILAKPENRQNQYNFPTKIGEYLVSGRPVLSTKVGIIGEILEDNKNVFFSKFDTKDLASKIEFIINNPKDAVEVGNEGREFALNNLHYKKHAKRMTNFFIEMVK
jgi:glycosyltransferase involved in cell wall biosynthesis